MAMAMAIAVAMAVAAAMAAEEEAELHHWGSADDSDVFCDFEGGGPRGGCGWGWNGSEPQQEALGFRLLRAGQLERLNATTRGPRLASPHADANADPRGHFLYMAVTPTSASAFGMSTTSVVLRSPPLRGLLEFCKLEVMLHQGGMQNASIKLMLESVESGLVWILHEISGNNLHEWQRASFDVGRVQQDVRLLLELEVAPPALPEDADAVELPHVAVDDLRLRDCRPPPPPPPGPHGACPARQTHCTVLHRESCVGPQQTCDLVADCDDGADERQRAHCDQMPYGSYCSFEVDECGFTNVPQRRGPSLLRWMRHRGPTPTARTGPTADHTCHGPPAAAAGAATEAPPPPLSPARVRLREETCAGYYMYVNMNVTGPNRERADFASSATMTSQVFNPPPGVHADATSPYFNCCMVRFYYQQNGRNYGSLSVDLVQITRRGNTTTTLWFSTKDKGENWYRATILLPNVTHRYYIQFKTRMGMRIYSDSAIDDFSMAPECFGLNIPPGELGGYNYYEPALEADARREAHPAFADKPYYRFTTCGASGRLGPTQRMCDAEYNRTGVQVEVLTEAPHAGLQAWEVPEHGLYTVIARGASGGLGSGGVGVSLGAEVRAVLELRQGERLLLLVGQRGGDACAKALSAHEGRPCARSLLLPPNGTRTYTSKTHEVRHTRVVDGGGGGGGGTFVFIRLEKEGSAHPLLVAGGGGGISVGAFRDDGSQHGRGLDPSPPQASQPSQPAPEAAGAGGDWLAAVTAVARRDGQQQQHQQGKALAEGGAACGGGEGDGGFGGGSGGCLRGGRGGGWAGGEQSDGDDGEGGEGFGMHGSGGWSFVEQGQAGARLLQRFTRVALAPSAGPGEVLLIPAINDCGCDYACVALDEERSQVHCYCPHGWTSTAVDDSRCIPPAVGADRAATWPHLLMYFVSIGLVLCASAAICICFYLYNAYQRRKSTQLRSKQSIQLQQLRCVHLNAQGQPMPLTWNPHYEAVCQEVQKLPNIARDSLHMIKALGQGAFGEVYEGVYKPGAGSGGVGSEVKGSDQEAQAEEAGMAVAVKTLLDVTGLAEQTESEFLMEAVIMAKFSHPNIVRLIGVCFESHPRLIVLELLSGGDLRSFLRLCRPQPQPEAEAPPEAKAEVKAEAAMEGPSPSKLTIKDQLRCALDIARGCRYLESKRFVHRDIAARNCLLTSHGPERVAKIADFGMARDIYHSEYYRKAGQVLLPVKWMPPEAYEDGIFTIKTDVWSFGVLMWEVFAMGVMPYAGCANREVMHFVSGGGRLEAPNGCPKDVYHLMHDCWHRVAESRPTFVAICERLKALIHEHSSGAAPNSEQ